MLRTVVVLSLLAPATFTAQRGYADAVVECESKTNGGNYFEITCPLASVGASEWRFRAHFTGVHDDSWAKAAVRVDGRDVTCDPGSATKLLGAGDEDSGGGDGFIDCKLVIEGRAVVDQELFVVLTWNHAQHTGHELVVLSRH